MATRGVGSGSGPRIDNKPEPIVTGGTGVQNAVTTKVRRWADIASRQGLDDAPDYEDLTEWDDAPAVDDLAEWLDDAADGPPEEDGEPSMFDSGSWLPAPRITFWREGAGVAYEVHTTRSDDAVLDTALAIQEYNWAGLAEQLGVHQAAAIRSPDLPSAYRALKPLDKQDIEISHGQMSRDRFVLIACPFGIVPLWFFTTMIDDPGVIDPLVRAARHISEHGNWPDPAERERLGMQAAMERRDKPTLLALCAHPEVIARHRTRWPLTDPGRLRDDLPDLTAKRWSEKVAVLALVGVLPISGVAAPGGVRRNCRPVGVRL